MDKLCTRCLLELKETANGMIESLSVFVDEVARVAREVGMEGKLEGRSKDVSPYEIIRKSHDLWQLDRLKAICS